MNYNTLRNKPTINHKELIGNNKASDIGGMTEEEFNTLMSTDLASYYTKAQIDELFSRSYVYREKSGSIVTFDCPSTSQTIPEVTVGIEATQSGSGDPSPTNVRPISGWSAVNVYDGPTTDPLDATTYTTALKDANNQPLTCYGGQLVNENGVQTLINIKQKKNLADLPLTKYKTYDAGIRVITPFFDSMPNDQLMNSLSNTFQFSTQWPTDGCWIVFANGGSKTSILIDSTISGLATDSTITEIKAWLTSIDAYMVYERSTPEEISQDNLAISTQDGTNNLWADTGDIEVKCLDRIIPAEE